MALPLMVVSDNCCTLIPRAVSYTCHRSDHPIVNDDILVIGGDVLVALSLYISNENGRNQETRLENLSLSHGGWNPLKVFHFTQLRSHTDSDN